MEIVTNVRTAGTRKMPHSTAFSAFFAGFGCSPHCEGRRVGGAVPFRPRPRDVVVLNFGHWLDHGGGFTLTQAPVSE